MNIGVLGTGVVGRTIGTRLVGLGHRACMGSRSANNEKAGAWAAAGPWRSRGSSRFRSRSLGGRRWPARTPAPWALPQRATGSIR